MKTIARYGSWKSPITSDQIVSSTVGLGSIRTEDETVYWAEMRPSEKGRITIVRQNAGGQPEDLLPSPWNARTRVHEYGGAAYLVHKGIIYFSDFSDQRLYRLVPGQEPQALTPPVDLRYADGVIDTRRGRLICIREDHTIEDKEAVNTITSLAVDGSDVENGGTVLVSGNDFYASPRLSPDGAHLAWLTWNHPNMPWDGTELWLADILPDGTLAIPTRIAGGQQESIFQPEWSPDGVLYFISDRTGWWNLYRWNNGQAEALHPMEAEFGEPQWSFGMSTYAFQDQDHLICIYSQQGKVSLAVLDLDSLAFKPVDMPFTEFGDMRATPTGAVCGAGSPTGSWVVVRINPTTGKHTVLRRSSNLTVNPGYLSIPQPVEFPTEHGLTAHALYYPPRNQDFTGPDGERPPLLVKSHGGPTGATSTTLNLGIQYWTSRGIAVLDVNYGGSTGYGRAYRERLKGQWGVVDVDDCTNGAMYMANQGKVDGERLAITGGSAGGYTTLCALTFRKAFKAGASHFGVSDVEALARDTHKFESRYLDGLIGPYPQERDLYIARSPIHFADQMECALILFQGSEDRVVPPNQSRKMFEAVRAKKLPVAYLEFEGEQHGFRHAENIKRALDGELYFYSRIFGFELADAVEPVQIENL